MLTSSVISWWHYFLCNKEMSKNPKNWWKLIKIANIDRNNLLNDLRNFKEIFRKDVSFHNIKSRKKQAFTLSLEVTFFEKQQCSNWLPVKLAVLGLTNFEIQKYHQNEPRFNGVYSRDNLPVKTKDVAYVINELMSILIL